MKTLGKGVMRSSTPNRSITGHLIPKRLVAKTLLFDDEDPMLQCGPPLMVKDKGKAASQPIVITSLERDSSPSYLQHFQVHSEKLLDGVYMKVLRHKPSSVEVREMN